MNDLKFDCRQLLKNSGFTVHPPQCCYGGRAVACLCGARRQAVLTLVSGNEANTDYSKGVTKP